MSHARFLRRSARFASTAVALMAVAALVGCGGGGDPAVAKAKAVFEQTTAANPQYLEFGLELGKGTRSSWVREQLYAAFGHEKFRTALTAVRALGEETPPEALEPLKLAFAEKKGALKLHLAIHLAQLGDAEALAWLKEQLAQPGAVPSADAVRLMGELGEQELMEPILAALMQADDLATRNEIYATLGRAGQPWATDLLMQGLGNERGEDRAQAIISLGETGDPEVAIEIERFHNTQGLVFATLESLGRLGNPKSVNAVQTMIDHDETAVRIYAAVALWRLGEKAAAEQVIDPLMADEDAVNRSVLAEQLADIDDMAARSRLAALAEDADGSVRLAAIRSVAFTATSADQPTLVKALALEDYQSVSAALAGLAQIGDRGSLDAVIPLMDSDNPYVALSAAAAVLSIAEAHPVSAG